MKSILLLVLGIIVLLLIIYSNHAICLRKERKLIVPLGKLVNLNGHNMNIYVEGSGDKTLVFMAGGGTCSPILDFKSLYSLLSDTYKIVVVEKFGYGFSDTVNVERNIESILNDTRTALKTVGMEGPYVLCPHSMSGIEALYWAQQYPEEISGIIGLDMAVPKAYENYKINMAILKLSQFAANIGITRLISGVAENDAIAHGTLTDYEKELCRAIFYRRTLTNTMLSEVASIKENAEKVDAGGIPQVPMLLFVSNGAGTGEKKNKWHSYSRTYIKGVGKGHIVELDCPHYLHNYEYTVISEKMTCFLSDQLGL